MAGLIVRREEGPKSEGVTSIVDDCDNRGGGWREKKRAEGSLFFFFFLVSLYFLPGVSMFGCGLRVNGSM